MTETSIPELEKEFYNESELKTIKDELIRFAAAKSEVIRKETVQEWIMSFRELRISFNEVIKRIKLAKVYNNPKSVTDFPFFMSVKLSDYGEFYKHEKKEIPEREFKANYGYAKPFKHYRDFKKEKYPIIDEMNLWFWETKSVIECIYLRGDNNISSYYPKTDFIIEQ